MSNLGRLSDVGAIWKHFNILVLREIFLTACVNVQSWKLCQDKLSRLDETQASYMLVSASIFSVAVISIERKSH